MILMLSDVYKRQVLISVLLTMLAGFVPSKKAAKQDPVIALRSE